MCVIIACENKRASKEWVDKAWNANPHGAGVAWIENGKVLYQKGLSLDEVKKLAAKMPLPYVLHFRIATVGGAKKALTHPFPIKEDVPLNLQGEAPAVLFHNGHWGAWKETLLKNLSRKNTLPRGKWSDTRAIAFLTHIHGKGFLKVLDEKVAVLSPKRGIQLYGTWDEQDGIKISNRHFLWGADWGGDAYDWKGPKHYDPRWRDEDDHVKGPKPYSGATQLGAERHRIGFSSAKPTITGTGRETYQVPKKLRPWWEKRGEEPTTLDEALPTQEELACEFGLGGGQGGKIMTDLELEAYLKEVEEREYQA